MSDECPASDASCLPATPATALTHSGDGCRPPERVAGCQACERDWDMEQGYLRTLGADAVERLRPPLSEVTVDVRVTLCPSHREQLHALIGPER